MLPQLKNLTTIRSHPLKNAVAVKQTVVIDADLRVFFVKQFAVDRNLEAHSGRALLWGGWGRGGIGRPSIRLTSIKPLGRNRELSETRPFDILDPTLESSLGQG
jgi:hypothetical protein